MKYKIKLSLESPLLVGGKKQGDNYIKSMDYIPGSVMRAAFARAITDRCGYERKNRWVVFENSDECHECPVKNLCSNFGKIRFSFMYPLDSIPYPVTNMRCKYDPSHPDVDTLIYMINRHRGQEVKFDGRCSKKGCGERLEKHTGLNKDGMDVEVDFRLITKNGISPYLKRSKEGILYSMDVVSEKCFAGDERVSTEFNGYVECDENINDELENIHVLRVGAYTTSGFGKCRMNVEGEGIYDSIPEMEERIKKFNEKINDGSKLYISFTLLSDAYLGLEQCFEDGVRPSQITTREYIESYGNVLGKYVCKGLKFEFPVAVNQVRRGFDTSKDEAVYRKAKIVTKIGSIFVFSTDKDSVNYKGLLDVQKEGIGCNREHGFGQVAVCSEFHSNEAVDVSRLVETHLG